MGDHGWFTGMELHLQSPPPRKQIMDEPTIFLTCNTQIRDVPEGSRRRSRVQIFHQIWLSADAAGCVPLDGVLQARYAVPGQGFRRDSQLRRVQDTAFFEQNYGPCW